jgi:hypothetical protein
MAKKVIYFSVMHNLIGTFPIRFENNCKYILYRVSPNKSYLSSARKREIFMIREQEEKIREEVDSEEEWRAIITSTDNGKKEKMG